MTVGERLKKIRGSEPVAGFAARLGVHYNTIRRYESGEREPDASFIRRLWERFGVEPNWLVTGEGEMFGERPRGGRSPELAENGVAELSKDQEVALRACTMLLQRAKLTKLYRIAPIANGTPQLSPTEQRLFRAVHAAPVEKKRFLLELAESLAESG